MLARHQFSKENSKEYNSQAREEGKNALSKMFYKEYSKLRKEAIADTDWKQIYTKEVLRTRSAR